jgi:hypothetical protein
VKACEDPSLVCGSYQRDVELPSCEGPCGLGQSVWSCEVTECEGLDYDLKSKK